MNASEAIAKMHGTLVSNLALSLGVHSPLIGLIVGLFGAVAYRVSLAANGGSRLKQFKQTAGCMAFPLKTRSRVHPPKEVENVASQVGPKNLPYAP
jgi:hypothetical protein